MKEYAILFSAPMVRAILDGAKTQTRRVVKLPHLNPLGHWEPAIIGGAGMVTSKGETVPEQGVIFHTRTGDSLMCPYGQPGDRIWVRETFYAFGRWETRFSTKKGRDEWHFVDMTLECGKAYAYAADGVPHEFKKGNQRNSITPSWWKRPAIFMPRVASRILPEITGVRVERLQDISEADAIEEGVERFVTDDTDLQGMWRDYSEDGMATGTAFGSFFTLWSSINGRASWDASPLVWVVGFKWVNAMLEAA